MLANKSARGSRKVAVIVRNLHSEDISAGLRTGPWVIGLLVF